MNKKIIVIIAILIIIILTCLIVIYRNINNQNIDDNTENQSIAKQENRNQTITNSNNYIEETNKYQNDFQIDVVLHTENRNIHHSRYIPNNIETLEEVPLYVTLPGYEGLYFQGVGVNLGEDFAFSAKRINPNMIILAPQLDDWGETSANDTISLIEYYKENYNISKVYTNGFSGGGETMSLVMGKRADLIDSYLQVSSKWDGDYKLTVQNEVPVYFFIGENDEYYGSKPTKDAYNTLYRMYQEKGLTKEQIDEILVLDVRDSSYFKNKGMSNQHAGGGLVANEETIMKWLLSR